MKLFKIISKEERENTKVSYPKSFSFEEIIGIVKQMRKLNLAKNFMISHVSPNMDYIVFTNISDCMDEVSLRKTVGMDVYVDVVHRKSDGKIIRYCMRKETEEESAVRSASHGKETIDDEEELFDGFLD